MKIPLGFNLLRIFLKIEYPDAQKKWKNLSIKYNRYLQNFSLKVSTTCFGSDMPCPEGVSSLFQGYFTAHLIKQVCRQGY